MIDVLQRLYTEHKLSDAELDKLANLVHNVYPGVSEAVLQAAHKQLKQGKPAAAPKPDMGSVWAHFLAEQNECVEGEFTLKSLALLLDELKNAARAKGYFTNMGMCFCIRTHY